MDQSHIRNFAIIAHIDHGKSTLADRLLEMTGTIQRRDMQEQILDSNPIERERGITIKLAPVRMKYAIQNSQCTVQNQKQGILNSEFYILNLIDTPGHVDFAYEVSRSLAACEGAILVVDSTQGVQAQTLANLTQARLHNLTIIPVINKIDMPHARVGETIEELKNLGFREDEMLQISAKTGQNVEQVLEAVVTRVPPPKGDTDKPLRALIFSSQYDPHKGVVVFVRVVDGSYHFDTNRPLQFMASSSSAQPIEVGYFIPRMKIADTLSTGEVGYIATGLKDIRMAKVGDTVTVQNSESKIQNQKQAQNFSTNNSKLVPLPGYKEPKPMVFLGLFPITSDEFTAAREAMEKLRLSDSAFTFRPISSLALGNGFHCGFLGLLHAEIVQERLVREFDLTMLATAPSVEYYLRLKSGVNPTKAGIVESRAVIEGDYAGCVAIQSATELPDPTYIDQVLEPVMNVTVFAPRTYVGAIMQLAQEKRGQYIDLVYQGDQAQFTYLIPLSEMIIDFFDRLKSISEGYASLDYEFFEYQVVDVVKLDILVNKEKVDAFATLVVREQAIYRGRELVEKLAREIPRQQFLIPVQAAIGGTVIARADVKAFRKDVIQKLYGGDRTRKDKLLDKQKKGKAKMKLIGKVEIPQRAFLEVLKRD